MILFIRHMKYDFVLVSCWRSQSGMNGWQKSSISQNNSVKLSCMASVSDFVGLETQNVPEQKPFLSPYPKLTLFIIRKP